MNVRFNMVKFSLGGLVARIRAVFSRLRKSRLALIEDKCFLQFMFNNGLLHQINDGTALCSMCGRRVTIESVAGFVVRDGGVGLICDLEATVNEGVIRDAA